MRRNIETTHYREHNGDGRIEGLERRVRLTLVFIEISRYCKMYDQYETYPNAVYNKIINKQ